MDLAFDKANFGNLTGLSSILKSLKSHCDSETDNHSDVYKETSNDPSVMARNIIIIIFDVIGLLGNLLSCIVIKKYLLKTSGTFILFLFLGIADSLVMVVITIEVLRHSYMQTLMSSTTIACGFHSFLFHFSFELSAWIILALTVERYLTIRAPFTHRDRAKIIRRAWIIGGTIMGALAAVNFHYFFTREAKTESVNLFCFKGNISVCHFRYQDSIGETVMQVTNYFHAFAYAYIPYIVTLGLNVILLFRLFVTRNYQQNRRTTIMLLMVTFSFIILTLPHAVYTIMINYINKDFQRELRKYVRDLARVLVIINHSLNFAFYMTGRQFRSAVHKLFCGHRYRRNSTRSCSRRLTSVPMLQNIRKSNNIFNTTRSSEVDQQHDRNGSEMVNLGQPTCPHHDFPKKHRNRHCSNSCL